MAAIDKRAASTCPRMLATGRAERLTSLDQMRGVVIGLVVLHHSILAYCTFGHVNLLNYALSTAPVVDPQRWVGFDLLVSLNDAFFMPLLFLLSGFFVLDRLGRRGARAFMRARVRRLGLPFVIAALTVIPLAYYPAFLQSGGRSGFGEFWLKTITSGPWPSGPPWFIGILLLFDAAATLLFVLQSRRGPTAATPHPAPRPASGVAALLAGSCVLYLPLLLAVGPTRWFGIGPLAIQGSRIGLYAAYFAAGVGLGRHGMPAIVIFAQALASRWTSWVLLAALAGATFISAAIGHAWIGVHPPPLSVLGVVQAGFCVTACTALAALFLRFGGRRSPAWNSLAANGFAIYLLHYPLVTWTQFGLLSTHAGALEKGAITFAVALAGSWAAAAVLRRLPAVDRVL